MEIKVLCASFAVTGQMRPQDIPEVQARNFRSIICNRPDGESPSQPDFKSVSKAAATAGLPIRHIPVSSDAIDEQAIEGKRKALNDLPKPCLAYCRSGGRSERLWRAGQHFLAVTNHDKDG